MFPKKILIKNPTYMPIYERCITNIKMGLAKFLCRLYLYTGVYFVRSRLQKTPYPQL